MSGIADGIFFSHVIEHIFPSRINSALSEFKRVLKKGGRLVIITPMEHPWFWIEGHVVVYNENKLRKLLLSTGFIPLGIMPDKKILRLPLSVWMIRLLNFSPVYFLRTNILAVGIVRKQ